MPHYDVPNFLEMVPELKWWMVPADVGTPTETGIAATLRDHRLEWRFLVRGRRIAYPRWNAEGPQLWLPKTNDIVFSAQAGDSVNLWRVPISAETGTVAGSPVRLTSGGGRRGYICHRWSRKTDLLEFRGQCGYLVATDQS